MTEIQNLASSEDRLTARPDTRSRSSRRWALLSTGAATLAFTVLLELIDPSRVSRGPTILDFEFAATPVRAAQILSEWGASGRNAAHLSLLLDYGYMLSYALFFLLAGFAIRDIARERRWRRLAITGRVVPYFAPVAAVFDASENVALLVTLAGNGGRFAAPFAAVCSAIKFALIAAAIVYVVCGLGMILRARLHRHPHDV